MVEFSSVSKIDHDIEIKWDGFTSFNEGGFITTRETLDDNGVRQLEEFENGIRKTVTQFDNLDPITGATPEDGGDKAWTERETRFDEGGFITARYTLNDNGVRQLEEFENGIRTTVTQFDNLDSITGATPEDGGAKVWTERETRFDENGDIESRGTSYDDGTTKHEKFVDGVLSESYQDDFLPGGISDTRPWSSISIYYDASGKINSRWVLRDDGTREVKRFEDGLLTGISVTDGIDPRTGGVVDGDGVKNWLRKYTLFGDNEVIESRHTRFDNGTQKLEEFEAGDLSEIRWHDGGEDSFEWKSTATRINDGVVTSEAILWDNRDQLVVFYENEEEAARLEIIGDGIAVWTIQLTEYDGDSPAVTIYADIQDVPEEYDMLLFDNFHLFY
ncbi:MAG: hypothetical protein ABJ370_00285 [Paracoccaceae bacterium]